ncbi:MAG TPA: glycosyltransferase family 9 protein, partial [Verrucomicrobiae bacterium]|nr:glycosyltransferase family 9 protein [Verrucomicrobiae bacterium]
EVAVKPEALAWARAWLGINGNNGDGIKWNNRTLLVAPGSGAPEKNWPREFFRDIVQWWQWSSSGQVVVVLGPAEDGDHAFWSECAAVARGLSLARLAALISLSDGYLGNDSGVTQLAAAVGATTLALFGPTDPAVWAPRRPRVSVARLGAECSPCAHPVMKSCPHRKCLKTFDPPDIMRLLKEKIP